MKRTSLFSWLGSGCAVGLNITAVQLPTISEISTWLAIAVSVLTIIYTITKWFKLAHADNKITKEEAEQLMKIVLDGAEEIKTIKMKQRRGE